MSRRLSPRDLHGFGASLEFLVEPLNRIGGAQHGPVDRVIVAAPQCLRAARNAYKSQSCGGVDNQDCLRAAVSNFRQNWDGIFARILLLRGSRKTLIRAMDIYNPYVEEDKASDSWSEDTNQDDFSILKFYLEQVNQYIAQTSPNFGAFAEVYKAFNGLAGDEDPAVKGLLAFDEFHANKSGHTLMASLLRDLGYAPLQP